MTKMLPWDAASGKQFPAIPPALPSNSGISFILPDKFKIRKMKPGSAVFLMWVLFSMGIQPAMGQKKKTAAAAAQPVSPQPDASLFSAFSFRSLGPATTSGRISDLAVNPANTAEYYVAVASGGVWKTQNRGTTFEPVFDGQGSYSIGCLAIDPLNSNVVWVGTGENNNQRSVAYGDGVYKTEDGGKTWTHTGLRQSEHIGRIAIHPTQPDIVYVAAYGPLWTSGGDRGIYKTTDGGKTWKQVLSVSEHTGFNEVFVDPRYPDIVYAAAHQRQRKVFAYIGGGPESALYKSTDGGNTWKKIMQGMPSGDIGRIGLNYFPGNPDVLYAIVEAGEGNGGVYKSTDRGASWKKQSAYFTSGNYYQKIYCDPKNEQRVYAMNTYTGVSNDGGKSFSILGEKSKHIDNHALWIDPEQTEHLLAGCDGGLYESYDGGQNWHFKPNLPVTQFYKVSTDNAQPFYHIHGGTQDNFSIGGPSKTTSINGIVNSDWYFTSIGDGFETQVDPLDPNIIYAQSQYGGLVRYDRRSGEFLDIKPVEGDGEAAYRWNWDAPLALSAFDAKRIYFAANKVFRSDDRGNSWKVISGDLSRGEDRNQWKLMGKVWSADAIAKNGSTDIYGQVTSISESPLDENMIWAGTDDGLVHLTTDGGQSWKRFDGLPGIPERSYVNQIIASRHDRLRAYAIFNHHRYGDFKPYVLRTSDGGASWQSISAKLPERGSAYALAEDHVDGQLLFVGTEFGVFCTLDGGLNWNALKSGLPVIAVRDLEIQRRENDLVLGTFGRGFYVLDDYAPLRQLASTVRSSADAALFPVKDAWMYVQSVPLGVRGKGFQGESYYTAENPKPGAVITCYLREAPTTPKERRREREKSLAEKGQDIPYPSMDSLRREDEQESPHLMCEIRDASGQVVRRLKAPAKKGIVRMHWDMRTASYGPIGFQSFDESFVFDAREPGHMVVPGTYTAALYLYNEGNYRSLAQEQRFSLKPLNNGSLGLADQEAISSFSKELAAFRRTLGAAESFRKDLVEKVKYIRQALLETPSLQVRLAGELRNLELQLIRANERLNGDATRARREFETLPSVNGRVGSIVYGLWSTTSAPTQTMMASLETARREYGEIHRALNDVDAKLRTIDQELDAAGAPHTPGRKPRWPAEK